MEKTGLMEIIFVTFNHNVTFLGKTWLILTLVLRLFVLLFSGYPLFRDEQERFVCNTIQPGCTNVCFDRFAPLSLFRFWLFQLIVLCIPHIMFVAYIIHKLSSTLRAFGSGSQTGPVFVPPQQAPPKRVPDFLSAYLLDLVLRIFLEAAFGAGQYYLYGFSVPRSFQCYESPCTSMVECYVARPTEKTIMLNFMLAAASLSLLVNLSDLVCSVRRVATRGRRRGEPGGELKNEGGLFANRRVGEDTEVLYNQNHTTPKTVLKRGPSHSDKPASSCYPNGDFSHGRMRINNDTRVRSGGPNLLGSRPPWREAKIDPTPPFQPMPMGAPSSGHFVHPKSISRTSPLPVSRRVERDPAVLSRLSTPSPLYSSQKHRRHAVVDTTPVELCSDSAESRDRLQEDMNMQEVGVRGSSSSSTDSSSSSDPE